MGQELTSRRVRIQHVLQQLFSPEELLVTDDSAAHAGHAGAAAAGETHFSIRIRAVSLAAMPRLAQHRAIHAALNDEFATGLHALSIQVE